MTLEEYKALKGIDAEAVISRMKKALRWKDEEGYRWDDVLSMAHACFMLWNMKHKDHYSTAEEYRKYCAGGEWHMNCDDVVNYLEGSNLWDEFIGLKDKFSDEELMAAVVFSKIWDYTDPASEGLLNLVDKCLDIHDGDTLTELCANEYEYSTFKGLRDEKINIVSYEDAYSVTSIAEARRQMMQLKNVTILGQAWDVVASDRVFCNFGEWDTVSDMARDILAGTDPSFAGLPETKSYTRDRIVSAIASMTEKGKAVLLMRAGDLSGREDEQVRRYLVENGLINGVIALTDKLYENTWINTYLLILSRGNKKIRFCDARKIYEKTRTENGKQFNILNEDDITAIYDDYLTGDSFSDDVTADIVKENDYVLLPQRYIGESASHKTCRLGECIRELSRGITLSSSETDMYVGKGSTRCITPMSLGNGVISKYNYFDKEHFDKKVNYAYRGDLLINKSGKPIRTAVADDTYAVIGNTYIIRLKYDGPNAYYIKSFLESPKGQAELMKYVVGESSQLITVPNLNKIEIPIYEKDKQREMERIASGYSISLQMAIWKMDELQEMFE